MSLSRVLWVQLLNHSWISRGVTIDLVNAIPLDCLGVAKLQVDIT